MTAALQKEVDESEMTAKDRATKNSLGPMATHLVLSSESAFATNAIRNCFSRSRPKMYLLGRVDKPRVMTATNNCLQKAYVNFQGTIVLHVCDIRTFFCHDHIVGSVWCRDAPTLQAHS
jgi:hypothetical protein